jgi:hypothetical protein
VISVDININVNTDSHNSAQYKLSPNIYYCSVIPEHPTPYLALSPSHTSSDYIEASNIHMSNTWVAKLSLSSVSATSHTFPHLQKYTLHLQIASYPLIPDGRMDSQTPTIHMNSGYHTTSCCSGCDHSQEMGILWAFTCLVFTSTMCFLITCCVNGHESRHLALFLHSCGVIVMYGIYLLTVDVRWKGNGASLFSCFIFAGAGLQPTSHIRK